MRHSKILGLLAVTAASLMAFVGTAFADTATSPAGTTYTGKEHFQSEGHVVVDNPIAKIECQYTQVTDINAHGFGLFISKKRTDSTFSNCTNDWHVTAVADGTESVNATGGSGEVFSSGATIEATRFGVNCRYATSNTKIGTITGGTPATLAFSASIPFHSGSFLCGSGSTTMTGSLIVTSPSTLIIDNN